MKKGIFTIIAALFASLAQAQESREVYGFLRLPVSAHVSALGGDNITITDDDATMIFHNPALLNNVTDKTVNLNYMTYMEGCKTASAAFVKSYNDRAQWGVAAQYMDYGTMKETTVENVQTGTFSSKDIAVSASLSYLLSDHFNGGITARFISSHLASYNSAAVAFDLGANYCDNEKGWSVSAVAKNLGGQVKAYEDDFERIPIDLQLGVTKRLIGSPLRLSAALTRLNNWDQAFIKHLNIGADLLLGENIYVAAGYNFRRSSEMKISDNEGESSHGAGFSIGGGLHLERFKLQVSYAKYHVSASSILINVSYSL